MVRGELPDDVYAGVQQLCAAGDEAAERGDFNEAIGLYQRALALLPSPPTDWEAATWIYAAIGDAYFFERDLTSALSAFEQALRSPDGIGNPFLHLRRGQILFDMGQETTAADELVRAYMSEGEEIFQAEDPKYIAHVKSVLRPPLATMIGKSVYLQSAEHRHYQERHKGTVLEIVDQKKGPKLLRVELEPPIPRWVYDLKDDLFEVYIAARHEGDSVVSAEGWPVPVYIAVPREEPDSADHWRILDWGMVEEG